MGFGALEYELVGFVIIACPVIDIVFAVTFGEEVGIALVVTTLHMVVTSAANEGVMAFAAIELVITRTAVQRIVTVIAVEGVVTVVTVQRIVTVIAVEGVVTVVTVQGIVAVTAGNAVITGSAMDGIVGNPAIARCTVVFEGFLRNIAYFQRGVIKLEMVLVG